MDQPIIDQPWRQVLAMFRRHAHELVFALVSIVAGAVLILSSFFPDYDPSPSFALLPDWLGTYMGVPAIIGGACILKAMLCQWTNIAARWALERFGLAVVTSVWAVYPLLILWYRPESILPALFPAGYAISSTIRNRTSRREERALRDYRGH